MKILKSSKALFRIVFAIVLVGGTAGSASAAEPQTGVSSTNSVAVKSSAPEAGPVAVKKQLTGAELYSIHCNRCHAERYPTERTGAQWKTIMLHMQVRANLPGQQARLILQYLQENSGR
jgi:hypothetical protein